VVLSKEQAEEFQETPGAAEFGVVHGTSGKPLQGGRVIGYERNAALSEAGLIRDANHYLRSQPSVFSGWWMTRSALMSGSTASVSPPDASDEPRQFLDEQFGVGEFRDAPRTRRNWEQYLGEFATDLYFGYGVHEEEYYREDGRDWLADWHYREPETINEAVPDEHEVLAGFIQRPLSPVWSSQDPSMVRFIRANQCVHLAHMATGANFRGIGLCRPIHPHAKDLEMVQQMLAVSTQRWGVGTPVGEINEKELKEANPGIKPAEIEAVRARTQQQLINWVSHAQAWFMRRHGVTIDILGGDQDPEPLLKAARYHERAILQVTLSQFLMLGGPDSSGSWSLGDVMEKAATRSLENVLQWIYGAINGRGRPGAGTVGRLMQWNFPTLKPREYPRLAYSGLAIKAYVAQIASIPQLQASGAVTWQDEDEIDLRSTIGMQTLASDNRRDATARQMATSRAGGRPPRVPAASIVEAQGRPGVPPELEDEPAPDEEPEP